MLEDGGRYHLGAVSVGDKGIVLTYNDRVKYRLKVASGYAEVDESEFICDCILKGLGASEQNTNEITYWIRPVKVGGNGYLLWFSSALMRLLYNECHITTYKDSEIICDCIAKGLKLNKPEGKE